MVSYLRITSLPPALRFPFVEDMPRRKDGIARLLCASFQGRDEQFIKALTLGNIKGFRRI